MPIDRDATLKRAETLLRQGKLDGAIEEYVRLVEDQPRDWNSINALGDLYLRAGNVDRAVAQFTRIADYLLAEGFLPKAAALYKKALKAKADDEHTLLQLFEIASRQGLLADAKMYLKQLSDQRTGRGDQRGAAECLVLLGALDEDDGESKMVAARAAEGLGDAKRAGELYRGAATAFEKQKRRSDVLEALVHAVTIEPADVDLRVRLARECIAAGDVERVRLFLTEETAGHDPELLLALALSEVGARRGAEARSVLTRLLTIAPDRDADVLRAAAEMTRRGDHDDAYVLVDVVADAALLGGDVDRAVTALQTFVRHARHLPALMKLVEVCVDSGLDVSMREAQAQLADACLDAGRPAEARVIAEDLVAWDPASEEHVDRLRRALQILGIENLEAVIADHRASKGVSADLTEMLTLDDELRSTGGDRQDELATVFATSADPVAERRLTPIVEVPPAIVVEAPLAPVAEEKTLEFDLSEVLASLQGTLAAPAVPESVHDPVPASGSAGAAGPQPDLDTVFEHMRARIGRDQQAVDGVDQYERGMEALKQGRINEATAALRTAAQIPLLRFQAGSQLGRVFISAGDLHQGIEWLERAAEAPAPTPDAGFAVLYELADALQGMGETARALAIFMELESDAGDYRDIRERIERLVRTESWSRTP